MCGFVISVKSELSGKHIAYAGVDITSRGPDLLLIKNIQIGSLNINIEFAHLFITEPKGYQPLESEEYLLILNGEIYNYKELSQEFSEGEGNDIQMFFSHIKYYGLELTLEKVNGMFSGVLINKESGTCIAFTDHIGKKPLLVWRSKFSLYIGTGLDEAYVDESSLSLNVLEPGVHEIDLSTGDTRLLSNYPSKPVCNKSLSELLLESVAARVPEHLPFAVALSGGLDSSVLAYIIEKQLRLTPHYFVIGEKLPKSVISLMAHLGISHERIRLVKPSNYNDLRSLMIDTCSVVKSYNPSIVSNGMATMVLAKAVHEAGYRVLIGGEGADEFFCGYQAMYSGKHCPHNMRESLIRDLHFTELRRVDLICSHYAIEARCPFLDRRVTSFAMSKPASSHCSSESKTGKMLLRNEYKGLLPDIIIDADKEPFDISSGVQRKVVEYLKEHGSSEREVLKKMYKEKFGRLDLYNLPYFNQYPVFDTMIDTRGNKYSS